MTKRSIKPKKIGGRYRVDFYYHDPAEQIRKRKRKWFRTREQADQYSKSTEVVTRLDRPNLTTATRTIGDLLDHYYNSVAYIRLDDSSKKRYQESLGSFLHFCTARSIERVVDFKPDDAREYQLFIELSFTGKGRAHRLDLASRIFRIEIKRDIPAISKNPFDALEADTIAKVKSRPRFFTHQELSRLFEVMDPAESLIFHFLYQTGIRSSEFLGLAWADVHEEFIDVHKQYHRGKLKPCKNKAFRRLPLSDSAKSCLNGLRSLHQGGYVIPESLRVKSHLFDRMFGRIKKRAITKYPSMAIALLAKEADERATPHTFRKTFASHLLQRGTPIAIVSELLGHSSVQVTELHYGALCFDSTKVAIPVLNQLAMDIGVDTKNENPAKKRDFPMILPFSSEGGIRTHDLRIMIPTL